MTAGPTQAI